MKITPTHTMILVTTRFGTYWINANWLRSTIVNAQAWNRKRNNR